MHQLYKCSDRWISILVEQHACIVKRYNLPKIFDLICSTTTSIKKWLEYVQVYHSMKISICYVATCPRVLDVGYGGGTTETIDIHNSGKKRKAKKEKKRLQGYL